MDFQYIVDENGRKKSVIVPIEEWEQLVHKQKKAVKTKKESRVLRELDEAVKELNLIKSGKKKPAKNLSQLLDEL
ncbi:MAG: hypothetical protein KIS94_03050 [Chitinophagales bacterium]|nr:hypothetical protein [Chitinophagales bacterium]